MKNALKLFVLTSSLLVLTACSNDAKCSCSNGDKDEEVVVHNKTINITSSNAGNFFRINAQSARKYYEDGYVMSYKISINLIGNYRLTSDVKFKIKTTAEYLYLSTTDTSNLTMLEGTTYISKEEGIIFSRYLDEVGNIVWNCICIEANGQIIPN